MRMSVQLGSSLAAPHTLTLSQFKRIAQERSSAQRKQGTLAIVTPTWDMMRILEVYSFCYFLQDGLLIKDAKFSQRPSFQLIV